MHPILNVAIRAAREAGKIINRGAMDIGALKVEQKDTNDFVSEIDRNAEQAIINVLKEAYPNHGFYGEESGKTNTEADNIWIIDPLDGTTNFLHNFPAYCISIALQEKGVLTQAVIYDPVRNDLFTATRGSGAFLNNRRIRVTQRTKLQEALLSTGFPFKDFSYLDTYINIFRDMAKKTAGLRRPGSAALDLAYVAAGFTDGFFEINLSPWDIAAGALLVQEAGGIVGDFEGNESWLRTGNIVAANPKVFGQMLQVIAPHLTERIKTPTLVA
ncbi:inositol monophosphatase family protein [Methylophilus sp. 14]|jgi:myo-inositol-1(or 4)-monophosphatase|uniref:inositol monophosphatase family protein n=1 Tax=Methylophilus sp. 14 TaxID=2781019 RepID=UPI001890805A|nr:inositol monophosphatase family protein [Methylophilus sp. 14]MBF4989185.1 inositol monophosphatase [Methylophilus sp. 14]